MRLKLGRPDLARHANRFDVPEASGDHGDLSVTFLGVASLLLDDGRTAVLTDGYFSRPSLLRIGLGKVAPDRGRIDAALARAGIGRLAAVVPVHTHVDHALDSAVVADLTGAELLGGESAANVGRGHGLPADRIRVATSGETVRYGDFSLTLIESDHCPPDRFPGAITEPVVPPVSAKAYRCGEAWSVLVEHASGPSALVQGSAGFVPGALAGRSAEVAYLGVGQLGVQDEEYVRTYWDETVGAVGARQVVLIHWDDFFRPLDRPLRAMPYVGDDLDATVRVLDELAHRDGVGLRFPTLWRREDPWAAAQPSSEG
ncbi:hypothetical protein [Nocardioides sp. W7]|uniref:MBL fold metallo-hydrolase n=1 Tax=Nocardioides sp. W7 TaxID=2931390 RepID=UPI001FD2A7B9|nr:hypothetical protein [Nocardioides sp. W7]